MPISKHNRKGKRKGQTGREKSAQLDAINKMLAETRRPKPDLADIVCVVRPLVSREEVVRDAYLQS